MVPTRRQTLAGIGVLLTGVSGCSGVEDTTATASPTASERDYTGRDDDPTSRTVRNPTGEPAVRSTLADSWPEWADTHWLVASRDDRDALYFADAATGVEEARSLVENTDFSAELVLVHQHPVDACETWVLDQLQWGEAGTDAPAGSAAVELSYRRTDREGDCDEDGEEDVAATFVRVPARFERVTRFGFGVS